MNKWSLYIGMVSGIKLFIHWTFLFLIAWITIRGLKEGENAMAILYTLAFILSAFVCVMLHELGHAIMAKQFHCITKDITLLPIGGIARMKEIPEKPKQELAVALAGPAINFLIALLLYPFVFWFGKIPTIFTVLMNTGDTFIFNLMIVNLGLAFFNLIPAFPMDGGRILRALLAMKLNREKATEIAARIGQGLATLFFIIGLFNNPVLVFIGVFIFFMAQTESDYVRSKSILHDYKVSDVLIRKYYSLHASDTIHEAAMALLDVQATDFLVMDNGKVIGTLDRNRIIKALTEKKGDVSITLAMNTEIKFLTSDMPLDKAYVLLQSNSILPVIENKKLIGVVDINNIIEFIMIKSIGNKEDIKTEKKELQLEVK